MRTLTLTVVLLAVAAGACSGKSGDGTGSAGTAAREDAVSLGDLNKLALKAVGQGSEVLLDGVEDMATAVVAELDGTAYLWLWKKGGGCGAIDAPADLRVGIALTADPELRTGAKPLPTSISPTHAVILVKGFNRAILPMGKPIGRIDQLSGTLTAGASVVGHVDLSDGYGTIKGNFKAQVCK